jgi:hypothetical protein
MEKGQLKAPIVIIWIVIVIMLLVVFFKFLSSFAEATPEVTALNDFKETVETVCADGGPTATSVVLDLPGTDSKFFKLHMAGGQVEVYKCSNLGSSGCNDAEKIKSSGLNCSSDIKFANCWIDAQHESVQVVVMKDTAARPNVISLNKTTGVYC